nr:MAG TPA: 43 kDa tail protein [Caudoviricetes sp.]
MSLGLDVYIYENDGTYKNIKDLIIDIKYSCSLDKVAQEINITLAYGVYSTAIPSFYISTGKRIEVYKGSRCFFKGKVEITSIQADKETESIVTYDYIRNLNKSSVTYNFDNISAFEAVCKVFNDLEIPYSVKGILGGPNGEGSNINISHLVKNKSAYDTCMMVATEVYRQTGTHYYMYMDVSGNVALTACDKYWSKQTIKPCSSPNLPNPDGNIISLSYKEDATGIVTRVKLYDSNGNAVDFETGESEESEDDE